MVGGPKGTAGAGQAVRGTFPYLDLTPIGRQGSQEEAGIMDRVRHHDDYDYDYDG
ncbi:hypothetical protein [Streptomyces sp. rh34]|uniref:hypothetical protein n=1 Tax=Streptomyces sp. rh34 TaxID=2034272 RepID=UPI001C54D32B|nr:hypothetical protein [Streptomyces sp. rh34]